MDKYAVLMPESQSDVQERLAIDRSCRGPVLLFFGAAVFWLLVGTLFGLLASVKMHVPDFMTTLFGAQSGVLSFGRIRPVHLNLVAYGWASVVGLGVAIWLMARLCRVPLRNAPLICAAGVLWNIGVLAGMCSVLIGNGTSIEYLEYPSYVTFILFLAYALVSIWAVDMFVHRKKGHVYVSQWYLFAALFWFPWLYGTTNILLNIQPVSGSVQGIINWWYGHNVLGLWFTPIGLASAYYFIPKVIGRPVHSYYLSAFGFWALALFYSWNGAHHLIGGPLPAWLITASSVASFMMFIPVLVTAINHHMTMKGHFDMLQYSPTLRFVVFGAMCYTAVSFQGSTMAIRSWNYLTHFTHYTIGHAHLGLYAFFTMVMFGAMYYIVPRLTGFGWKSAAMIKIHFWTCAYGVLMMFVVLTIGGLVQGEMMLNAQGAHNTFPDVVEATKPYLIGRSISGVLILIGHLTFGWHFTKMLLAMRHAPAAEPLSQTVETEREEAAL